MRRRLPVEIDIAAAARLVLDSYVDFLGRPMPEAERGDSKAFAARHAAARSALAHLDHLEKLAEGDGDTAQQQALGSILAEARRQLATIPDEAMEEADGETGGDA
ncbi:hypothetical protein [Roseicella frigidaeris]|uniref:DUF1844 domain-containing protein n=1 Tax=Roseicella frigidaeris TaxID=2230885 RepID=A0A327M8S3_9PROT|nr:hypothetical protein [Roseicella frigidaeris]RAI58756.1 hypothetical protein DOO78_11785 [Roseicella frigidaeris]